jgi:hypothetical protein
MLERVFGQVDWLEIIDIGGGCCQQ